MTYIGSFLGYAMTAARYLAVQTPLFASLTLGMGLICFVWVPRYGLRGAAMAQVILPLVQLAGSAVIVAHAAGRRKSSA